MNKNTNESAILKRRKYQMERHWKMKAIKKEQEEKAIGSIHVNSVLNLKITKIPKKYQSCFKENLKIAKEFFDKVNKLIILDKDIESFLIKKGLIKGL
jgi:hypothetical protein